MIADHLILPVLIAGLLLGTMSVVDTLSYGVRTAGVLTKRLAISLSLFNIIVIFSRLSNMAVMPVLGNFPDKVLQSVYTAPEVLVALRVDLLFVVGGVIVGGLLTPSFINLTKRGIEVMEDKGSLPPLIWHGLSRLNRLPSYLELPRLCIAREYLDYRKIPTKFLLFNIFVTCFYSIGVMSTILAASWDHSVAVTTAMLSGIVNGIATMLLFAVVDPPAAVLTDNCIAGKRPESHAKTMNLFLILTRLIGCMLAIVLLPLMASYVLTTAHWVDQVFAASQTEPVSLGQVEIQHRELLYLFTVEKTGANSTFRLELTNNSDSAQLITYNSGAKVDFMVKDGAKTVWSRNQGLRFTQAIETMELAPGASIIFQSDWEPPADFPPPGTSMLTVQAVHLWAGNETTVSFKVGRDNW